MSMPASRCSRITSLTPRRMTASKWVRSYASPRSCANRRSATSCGRGKLPTCVVRIRSVLVFISGGRAMLLLLGAFAFRIVLQVPFALHARVLHLFVVWLGIPADLERDFPGPGEHFWVIERRFISDRVRIRHGIALGHVQ